MKNTKTNNTFLSLTTMSFVAMSFVANASYANYLTNYGEPNTQHLTQAIGAKSLHVVQLGDSHTAGDVMTEALRNRLQLVLGNGGMGWAMPMYFSGQRMARFGYDNVNFMPVSSRSNTKENYTLGGMIAKPKAQGASLTLKAKKFESPQRLWVSIRQAPSDGRFVATDASGQKVAIEASNKNNTWQLVAITASLPITIYNESANHSAIGGWWAFNQSGHGAVVSALGINGAELSYWNRWQDKAWQSELSAIRPHLFVIAYGTNEAYNGVSGETVRSELTKRIRQIRQASPTTAILIMGAPEALKSTAGGCGTRPSKLSDIQNVQRQVAQTERTLYWDWQAAMGGSCSMKSWINQGKASRDGVHFTQAGYNEFGYRFANDLLALSTKSYTGAPPSAPAPVTVSPSSSAAPPSPTQGSGRIYISNGKTTISNAQ